MLRSRAEIDRLVVEWRDSGCSVRNFAEAKGLAESTLYQWVAARRLESPKKDYLASQGGQTTQGFARIEVAEATPTGSASLTIETRGGRRVLVGGGKIDGERLRRVVEALEAC